MPALSAYAARAAGGGVVSLLLINTDPRRSRSVEVRVGGRPLDGPGDLYLVGPARSGWHARGADGYASPDGPPLQRRLGPDAVRLSRPAFSMAVVRARCERRCG